MNRIAKLVGLAGARVLAKPYHAHFSLKAVASAARPRGVALRGYFFGFAFFTADFLAPFFALLFESPAAPSPALRPLPRSALAAR